VKTLPVLTLLLILVSPSARAQQQPNPPLDDRVQLELLELEQDVDKTLLKEAMLLLGRKELRPLAERPTVEGAKHREERDVESLMKFIATRKDAITERSAALSKARREVKRVANPQPVQRPDQAVGQERQALIARYSEAQVESQLLQRRSELFQKALNEAVELLAGAELAASTDEAKRKDVEDAAKQFDRAKSNYVEISKKLMAVQNDIFEIQQRMGFGGMGGMGGMGGGFR
jgi:hypothetical protein